MAHRHVQSYLLPPLASEASESAERPPWVATLFCLGVTLGILTAASSSGMAGGGWDGLIQANEPVIFSVTGDVPYGTAEISEFQQQIDEHDLYSPSEFLSHVGDIKSGSESCSEERYQVVEGILKSSEVPCYIVPGDNETTDCSNPTQGWSYWVKHLLGIEQSWPCSPVTERQSGRQENFAFLHKGMLFIGINLVGGTNDSRIMQDDAAWVTQQLQQKVGQVRGAVIFAQAGPGNNRSTFFTPFESAAASFGKPILYIHGDGHSWKLDKPFSASNVTRVQVEAGGNELPVQVTATLDSQNMFQFKRNPWSSSSPVVTRPPCGGSLPLMAISDVVLDEGDSGTRNAVFTVTLTDPNGQSSSVQYATANGSAQAGSDYVATSGSLSFSSSTTSRTISVPVVGDLNLEPDEIFYVDLSSPVNAALADGRGQATIRNDDGSNGVPLARSDAFSTNEEVSLVVSAPGVLANDSDPDGDPLTASLQSGTSSGTLSLNSNGSFVYTPDANFSGSDEFTYAVNDGRGGTASASVTIEVNPVNDVPVAVADAWITGVSTPLSVPAPGVLGNDTDADGDVLTAQVEVLPQHGSLLLSPDGSFTYTPSTGFDGIDGFTYRARDAVSASSATTVQISVGGPVSAGFTAIADASVSLPKPSTNYGTSSELRVRAGKREERSYLRFQVSGFSTVANARLRLYVSDTSNDGGSLYLVSNSYKGTTTTWTESGINWNNAPALPASSAAELGNLSSNGWIEVDVSSVVTGSGTYCFALSSSSSNLARYMSREAANKPELLVERASGGGTPGNQQPLAGADSYGATEDVVLNVAAPGVLGNDSDPDGDPLSVVGNSNPAHGSVSIQANGGFTYTPAANYHGSDGFTYSLSDGRGGLTTGSVSLAVGSVNDAPAAAADQWSMAQGGVLTVSAPGVLANDSDVDGDALTAVLVTPPAHGSLNLGANGSFVYTPDPAFAGADAFHYKASDGALQSTDTVVSLSVGSTSSGEVSFVEARIGGSAGIASVSTSTSLGTAAGDFYLAAISMKPLRAVTQVTGMGLTWTRVEAQCSGRSQTGIEIWSARGTPTSGVVTATLAAAPQNTVLAVARYSGADAASPLGTRVSGNTNGSGGACDGGIDGTSFHFDLSTSGGMVFGATAMRNHLLTPGSGYTERLEQVQGTGGSAASVALVDRPTDGGLVAVDGTFDGSVDWAVVAVEIRPSSPTAKSTTANDPGVETKLGVALERVFPNPVHESAAVAYDLSVATQVEFSVYNARGQRIRMLQNGPQDPGRHLLHWDTRDEAGLPVPAGIYFVRLRMGERAVKQKVVVQR